jgi:hypothetical protein
MQGDIDAARALHDEADDIIEDLGIGYLSTNTVFTRTLLELLAGAPAQPSEPRAPAWRPSRPCTTAIRDRPQPPS